jgi:hypothetical protein
MWINAPQEEAMEHIATQEFKRSLEDPVDKAFLMAHLLTADTDRAERAMMEAIRSWNPSTDTGAVLLQNVIEAAARADVRPAGSNGTPAGSCFPAELQAVLKLEPPLRRCFVLRILAGLPSQACARLLHSDSRRVDRYTRAALQCLGAGMPVSLHSSQRLRTAA